MSSLKFKGVTDYGNSLVSDQITTNLSEWLKWGFLGIGAFTNVRFAASGVYGGQLDKLRLVDDPNYNAGQVWEGFRNNWVYESGVNYGYQPVQISGIFTDSTWRPLNEAGAYSYYINYPLGQVVFNTAIPTNTNVRLEYSYRHVNIQTADVPWFREVMLNSFRPDNQQFLQVGSGAWNVLAQNRIQLPAVIVEAIPQFRFKGAALGGGQNHFHDVLFHVIAENPWERNQIADCIAYQNDSTVAFFDVNEMVAQNRFPLNQYGALQSGATNWPVWIAGTGLGGLHWKTAFLQNTVGMEGPQTPLVFTGIVKTTCEVIIGEI